MGAGLPLLQERGQVLGQSCLRVRAAAWAFDITLLRGGAAGGRLVDHEAQTWRQRVFQCSLLDDEAGCGFTDVRRWEVADACSGNRVDALGTGRLGLEINWEALGRRCIAGRQS